MPQPPLRLANKFRSYQRRAIAKARAYRSAFLADNTDGAALVCHPTGTGKTAVIAALAQCCPEIGSVLVLTTREAVRDQLVRELAGDIFLNPQKFGCNARLQLSKSVFVFAHLTAGLEEVSSVHSSTLQLLSETNREFAKRTFARTATRPQKPLLSVLADGKAVIVMTVQMLALLEREHQGGNPSYPGLKKSDLILFDEGHYEPAAVWSQVVRGLERPIVLLSATPFRNDLKPFQIAGGNVDIYQYKTACAASYVRRVTVEPRASLPGATAFCEDVITFCTERFGKRVEGWPRVIIHCDESSRITLLARAFIAKGFQVIGIHDRFPDPTAPQGWQYHKVPPPRETVAQIWIHQYKLMEGIDDHRFRVLAFFDLMTNLRSVVQQIGRIIRSTPGKKDEEAYVLDHYRGRLAQYWELYKDYDESLTADYLTKSLPRYYLDKFIAAHPPVDYIARKFRRRLVIEEVNDAADEILFERRVTFKIADPKATLSEYAELLEARFLVSDIRCSRRLNGPDAVMYLYVSIETPPFLNSRFFAEARHGACLLMLTQGRRQRLLAIAEAGSSTLPGFGALPAPEPSELERLVARGKAGRITSASSQNTSLGNRVIRRRTFSAPSIADVPPILDEHGFVLSTLTGYNGDQPRIVDEVDYIPLEVGVDLVDRAAAPALPGAAAAPAGAPPVGAPELLRRYIGLTTGRVSEVGPPLRFHALRDWVASLTEQMRSGKPAPGVVTRYARRAKHPVDDTLANNLLLDLLDIEDLFIHESTGKELRGEDVCVQRQDIVASSRGGAAARFTVRLNDETFPVEVSYLKVSQRYRIDSEELDTAFVSKDNRRKPRLTRVLNDMQAFNIIPDDLRVIYVHGRFYAPGTKFGDRFDPQSFFVGRSLYPSSVLRGISEEKGSCVIKADGTRAQADGETYDPHSLFALIDGSCEGFDTATLAMPHAWIAEYGLESVTFTPTMVICDDMKKESADFLLADEGEQRFILVHAKASDVWRPFSASAVQEVCAQAQKNTALLSLFSLQKPGNLSVWDDPHRFTGSNRVSLSVTRRIRKPLTLQASAAWKRLAPLLRNPLATREVWLLLGNMLSASEFAESMKSNDPIPETLQLNHLLQTTIASIGAAGAKVRVFCSP